MNDTVNDTLTEQQQQTAWEKVLRGEWVEDGNIHPQDRHSADAIRSFLQWEQAMQLPATANDIEKQRDWKRLASDILPTPAKKKPVAPKWWMSVAASLMLAVLLVPVWQSFQQSDDLNRLNEGEAVWIEKGQGIVIYEAIQTEQPEQYAKTLRKKLLKAGFQVSPIEEDGDAYLLRLQATGNITESMVAVLTEYDLALKPQGNLSLSIGR